MIRLSFALAVCSIVLVGCSSETPAGKTVPSAVEPAPAASAADYEIRIDGPTAVGSRRDVQVIGTLAKGWETKNAGKHDKGKSSKTEFFFTAAVKTLAVNERGIETKAEIVVDRFAVGDEKQKPQTILDARTIVVAEAGAGNTEFRRPDGELPKEAVYVLGKIFPMHTQLGSATENDVFGTSARQKIGASWPLDKIAAQKYAKELAGELPADAITGSGKLVRTVDVNGVACLEIQLTLSCKQNTAPGPPKGMKGAGTSFLLSRTDKVPVASPTGPVERRTRIESRESFRGVPGTLQEDRTLDVQTDETLEMKIKYPSK